MYRWFKRRRLEAAVCVLLPAAPVIGQELPDDRIFTFGISQKFAATDNIRLQPNSAGTTAYSDTKLSFGIESHTPGHRLQFAADGVVRIVDDPIIGTDSGFRDPSAQLSYGRESANSRLSLLVDYDRPDLAFLDPLQQGNITDQDFYTGGGTREDTRVGLSLETGLQSPLGLAFEADSSRRSYSDTTDPLLFSNQTDYAAMSAFMRFSQVTQGRLNLSEEQYRAEDTIRTERQTRRLTFGLDHAISAITSISAEFGHSKVRETPTVGTVISGPIGAVSLTRLLPDGQAGATLDTVLTSRGRQTTLEFGRTMELPAGGLALSIGVTAGKSFDPRPIGLIDFTRETPNGALSARISRSSSISDTLSQATETTEASLGYSFIINDLSSLSFDLYYADISLIGNNSAGGGRERGSLYVTYAHRITRDWDLLLGYQHSYFSPNTGAASRSNTVLFSLGRSLALSP